MEGIISTKKKGKLTYIVKKIFPDEVVVALLLHTT